jgi:hypothetical protein
MVSTKEDDDGGSSAREKRAIVVWLEEDFTEFGGFHW